MCSGWPASTASRTCSATSLSALGLHGFGNRDAHLAESSLAHRPQEVEVPQVDRPFKVDFLRFQGQFALGRELEAGD